jgi:hypothetical protein
MFVISCLPYLNLAAAFAAMTGPQRSPRLSIEQALGRIECRCDPCPARERRHRHLDTEACISRERVEKRAKR